MFQSPGNVFFQIGNHEVYYYSVCISIAIIVGTFVAYIITKKYYRHIDIAIFENYTPPIIIGAILGARLYYVFLCWDYFSKHLSEIPMIWHGGLTIHGAIAGGVLVGFIKTRIDKTSFIECCDAAPWGLLVGQAIGRWGNFFNSEAHGAVTTLATLKNMLIPDFVIEGMNIGGFYYHPTFYYEFLWCVAGFILLVILRRRKYLKVGQLTSTYFMWYSAGRFFIESLRTDSLMLGGFKVAQLVSVLLFLIALGAMMIISRKGKFEDLYNEEL